MTGTIYGGGGGGKYLVYMCNDVGRRRVRFERYERIAEPYTRRNGGIEKNPRRYYFCGRPIRLIIYSFSVRSVNGARAIDACQMRRRGNSERSDEFVLLFGSDCAKSIEICVRVLQGTLFFVFFPFLRNNNNRKKYI